MLSAKNQIKTCFFKNTLPLLDEPTNVRIKFRKVGNLQYISHLDLQRTFHRILVRAGIPMWYTQGFNPHAKIVFSAPLSIGLQSECEFVDIRIDRKISCELIKNLLNNEVTDELRILEVYIPTTKFSDMGWASYKIEIFRDEFDDCLIKKLNLITSKTELSITKKTKSGEKNIDIIPLVNKFQAFSSKNNRKIEIDAVLKLDSDNYLNPQLLLDALNVEYNVLGNDVEKTEYTIVRTSVFCEDGVTLFK